MPRLSRPFSSWLLATLSAVGWACSPASGGPSGPSTEIMVGVQAEPLNGAIGTLHIVTKVAGVASTDELVPLSGLPHEVKLTPPAGSAAAPVAVTIDGYTQSGWTPKQGGAPLLVRTAETSFVPDQTRLLRVMLQGQCLLALPKGPPGAPTCTAPRTCIGGSCQSDVVSPSSLETYSPGWPADAPDICRGLDAGAPVVQVGQGQTDYLPVTSGQVVQMEQGPQGGHHVWIAVRQENIKQQGSTTTLTSVQPGTNLAGPEMAFVFTFEPDQGGFCKLSGLRYQVDIDGTDYHLFLGKPLDVTVKIADQAGHVGTGVAHLNVSPTLLCPVGVPGC